MINLQYEAPIEALTPFVSSFYRFEYDGEARTELERANRAQFWVSLRGPDPRLRRDKNVRVVLLQLWVRRRHRLKRWPMD
jgi:hypothetical protein